MNIAGRHIGNWTARFFSWWWGEVKDLMPDRLIGHGSEPDEHLVLQLEDDDLVCWRCRGGQNVSELYRIAADGADPADEQAFVATVHAHLKGTAGTTLRMTNKYVVRRLIALPLATLQNLRQVLAFEMDRHTPFQAADVYYDFRVLNETDAGLTVELIAVPRQTLDRWMDKLAAMGISLDAVDVVHAGEDTPQICGDSAINLLPDERRPPATDRRLTRLNVGLAGVAGVLLLLVLATPLFQMHHTRTTLQKQTDAARVQAEEVAALRDQLQNRIEQIQQLVDSKNGTPPMVELFAELARVLPDHTWLGQVQFKEGKFLIQGESASASGLLGLIEDSPVFGGMSFMSPVTQNPRTGRERFRIAFQAGGG